MAEGFAIWLTGLPSSGKTTLGKALASNLTEQGLAVEVLDGDELRQSLSADLGFSAKDRREHAGRVIKLCEAVISQGVIGIVPLISPYRETRVVARRELRRFVEVYVKCPIEECIRRDVKGLYAKALKGEILQFTGVSDPYEEPISPEVTVETHLQSVEDSCRRILGHASVQNYLSSLRQGISSRAGLIGSLKAGRKMSGCRRRNSYKAVVPDLGAPTMKKLGFLIRA